MVDEKSDEVGRMFELRRCRARPLLRNKSAGQAGVLAATARSKWAHTALGGFSCLRMAENKPSYSAVCLAGKCRSFRQRLRRRRRWARRAATAIAIAVAVRATANAKESFCRLPAKLGLPQQGRPNRPSHSDWRSGVSNEPAALVALATSWIQLADLLVAIAVAVAVAFATPRSAHLANKGCPSIQVERTRRGCLDASEYARDDAHLAAELAC